MTDYVAFRVDGEPIPQGSKKAFKVGKRINIVDDNAALLKPWRKKIAEAADLGRTFDCPVVLDATFYLTRPKTVKRAYPTTVPDLDKLMRALGDGMKDGGLIRDDSIIVDEHIRKRYADGKKPGIAVILREVE